MRVQWNRRGILAIVCAATSLAGCSSSTPGDFQTYDQLPSAAPASTTARFATGEGEPAASPPQDAPADPEADATVSTAELPATVANRPAATPPLAEVVAVAELPETTQTVAASPRKVELLVPHKEFRKEAGALRVSYDDFDLLKVLNLDPVTPDALHLMPSWLKGLDGQRIRVRGFMYPTFEETGLTRFVLARDNQICCFGRNPKIYDLVDVSMRDGVTADYIQNRPFDVVGVFRIRPDGDETTLDQLYFIEDAVVIDR